jgi:dCMP deaminase
MTKKKSRSVPPWEDYLMGLAFLAASRSKDPDTQHGCILVDDDHNVVSTGYNGPPPSALDSEIDWNRPFKYDIIIHAEQNAIRRCPSYVNFKDVTLYVTGPPCHECFKQIVSRKIKKVIYGPQTSTMVDEREWQKSKDLVKLTRCTTVERYQGNLNWMRDRMDWMLKNMTEVFQPIAVMPV